MPGKRKLTHTPFLDAWRAQLIAATAPRGSAADLARYLSTQGRRTLRSNRNLITDIRNATLVPNAEDFLAISHWMATERGL